jgi:hypothetical protein
MNKQINFSHPIIRTPSIMSSGYNKDGRFYFDMKYIRGYSMSKVFTNQSIKVGMKVLEKLMSFEQKTLIDISSNVKEKIDSLSIDTHDKNIIMSCDWNVKDGYCHGDMTFENIIVADEEVYLIDFLDSFADAPIVDHAKILQDSFCYWSFGEGHIPKRKLLSVCDMFDTKEHYCMLLLHLHRIIPYANASTKEKVLCMMSRVRQKISRY